MKVLVVDDDPLARKILCKALKEWGHTTQEAVNGRVAWEALYDDPSINLVVTDMVMPDMDGRELVILIRSSHSRPELPVFIISGLLNPHDVNDVIDLGNAQFFPKPVDLDRLQQLVEDVSRKDSSLAIE